MKRVALVAFSLFLWSHTLSAITLTVVAKGKLLTMNHPDFREVSQSVDIITKKSGDPRCVDTGTTQLSVDAGCQLDLSRTYTTNTTPQCDASFGQGGAGYGIVVDSCLQHDGQGSHSMSGNTLTSNVQVCRKKNTTQRGWYKARHVVYEKCPTLEDWTQTYVYNFSPAGATWQYVSTLNPAPPAGVQNLTFTISVNPSSYVLQSGLFSGDPNLSGDKGLHLWIKPGNNNDVQISAVEVTQGIQNLANEMPLVAGRRTIVRAHIKATLDNVNAVRATLVAHRNGVQLGAAIDAENTAAIRTTGGNRITLDDAYWFLVPPAWRNSNSGPVTFTVTVDPDNAVPELDESNNTRAVTVDFHVAAPLLLTGVPFHLHVDGDKNKPIRTYLQSDQTFLPIARNVFRYHPISTMLLFDCGTPIQYPALHNNGHEWDATKNATWVVLLARVAAVRALSGCTPGLALWAGMIHPDIDTGEISGISIPTQRSSWTSMSSVTSNQEPWLMYGGETMAHELGHNAGLPHVKCAGDETFPVWDAYPHPYPDCRLATGDDGYFGLDVYYDAWNFNAPSVISNDPNAPAGHRAFPFMGYRGPEWTDPFDYCLLLVAEGIPCNPLLMKRQMAPGSRPIEAPTIEASTIETRELAAAPVGADPGPRRLRRAPKFFLVSGVYDAGSKTFPDLNVTELTQLSSNAQIAPATQRTELTQRRMPLEIVQVDGAGKDLSSRIIQSFATSGSPSLIPFLEVMPQSAGVRGIRIRQGGAVLVERMASSNKPAVHFLAPDAGTLYPNAKIMWNASDADDDPLSFSVLYSADAGRSWRPLAVDVREQSVTLSNVRVPGSATGVIRILASDGFYTSYDDSDSPLRVPTSAPTAMIMQRDGLYVPAGRTLILEGMATDIDEGPITLPSSFRWTSDRDGVLGTGQELYKRNLSKGVHLITLEVRDVERKLGSTSIRVYVGVAPPQPAKDVPITQ